MKFVGWDWASTSHDVTILDEQGRVVERWALRHTVQGLGQALARLARHGQPAELPVIIERSTGLVVDRLLAAGHPVVPVHPTAFHAARPRWGAAGGKSDPGDSYKLADYLRTDGHRLRRLQPLDPGLRELQALVRLREDHVRARTAASNQLGALLDAYWPGPKAMFCKLASDIALAFLTDYPTPQAAARLGQARLAEGRVPRNGGNEGVVVNRSDDARVDRQVATSSAVALLTSLGRRPSPLVWVSSCPGWSRRSPTLGELGDRPAGDATSSTASRLDYSVNSRRGLRCLSSMGTSSSRRRCPASGGAPSEQIVRRSQAGYRRRRAVGDRGESVGCGWPVDSGSVDMDVDVVRS